MALGARISLKGKGGSGTGGGLRGDLLHGVRIAPHVVFPIEGKHIFVDVPIAALEAKVEVPTLDREVSMGVPSSVPSGKRFRWLGKGPQTKNGQPGDVYVLVRIVEPESLTRDERERFEQPAAKGSFKARA